MGKHSKSTLKVKPVDISRFSPSFKRRNKLEQVTMRLFAEDLAKLREESARTGYPWQMRVRLLVSEGVNAKRMVS